MTKKKILFIISNINMGGAENLLLSLCKGIKKSNIDLEIRIITYFEGDALKSDFEQIGIPVDCLNIPKKSSITVILKKLWLSFKYIKQFNPDIVHTQLLDTDRYGLVAAFFAGVKHRFSTVHNIELDETTGYKITRKITSIFATKIIFVAECAMTHYCTKGIYPLKKSIVINNAPGIDRSDFTPKKFFDKTKTIKLVNIGRLQPQKGQLYLIQAMNEMQRNGYNFELHIYGGDYQNCRVALEAEKDRLKLSNVYFEGVSRNIVDVLVNGDIFISSSLFEAAPLVILEAITVGIPVIASDIAPHREILASIKNYDLFFPIKDPVSISKKVIELVENPKHYEEISANSLLRAQDFSQRKMVENYKRLYSV